MTKHKQALQLPPQFVLSHYADIKQKRVLIADCHAAVRTYLRSQLAMLEVKQVHGAVSSADVLRLVSATQYDIILCDYMLDDGRDGQQLLEELRTKRLIPVSTIFIIVTGERGYKNVVAVAELGPDEYLIKPFTADDLYGRLMRALYKRKIFENVYKAIERNEPDRAIQACDMVAADHPNFLFDALRMKGELLNAQHRYAEAEEIYRMVIERKVIPWAKMGLAFSLFQQGELDESRRLAQELIDDFPEYLVAHDFLAKVQEAAGEIANAQETLQRATAISPKNTSRQRAVGDIAVRNEDLETAHTAYSTVLARGANTSVTTPDDYANLARVKLERGDMAGAAMVAVSLRRDRPGDKAAELASYVVDSMVAGRHGNTEQAKALIDRALALHTEGNDSEEEPLQLSTKLTMDLAHACMESGRGDIGEQLVKQVATEHHEDDAVIGQIRRVFTQLGREGEAEALMDQVNQEIVAINNQGVRRARDGDLEGSVQLLVQAASRVPNIQFLINATKAIFTLMERKGWNNELALQGVGFLRQAMGKDVANPKVTEARALCRAVANKYGVPAETLGA